MKLRSIQDVLATDLRADLTDPDFARGYLQAAEEEARANGDGGILELAKDDIRMAQKIPERDMWLYRNPQALAQFNRGLAEAASGLVSPAEDYNQYADLEKE